MTQGMLSASAEDWQRCWHAILDRNGVEMEGSRPTRCRPMDEDFRLHFAFWTLDADRGPSIRAEALRLLPQGAALAERIERQLRTPRHRMARGEAEAVLRDGLRAVRTSGIDAPDEAGDVRFLDAGTIAYLDAFREASSPFEALGDALPDRAELRSGPIGRKAYFFLSEPLYRLASDYAGRDWAIWPLCSHGGEPDLAEAGWRLSKGCWVPGWDANGLFLYRFPDAE